MNNGWIKLHRKILDNWIIKKPAYLTIWIILLLNANHKKKEFMWNKRIISIKEGQFITGRKELSKQTGIPESTIEDILKALEIQHQIQQQKTTKFRLITILNWKDYQKPDSNSNNKATTKQQQSDTTKNDKNIKNEKNKDKSLVKLGNPDVNDFMDTFKREFGLNVLDDSVATNRQYAWLAIKKCSGLANAKKVIELAARDDFYGDKITGVKKFYYHMVEITKKGSESFKTDELLKDIRTSK